MVELRSFELWKVEEAARPRIEATPAVLAARFGYLPSDLVANLNNIETEAVDLRQRLLLLLP